MMKRNFKTYIVLILVSLFSFFGFAYAQNQQNESELFNLPRTGETIIIEEDDVIEGDLLTAGENIEIYGTVNGDLYAAGGTVLIEGQINGDALVAGGNVRITGEITEDLRTAGGNVYVLGTIGRNITALTGNLMLEETSEISGSLVTAGGNVYVNTPLNQGMTATAGNIFITEEISGDVKLTVGQLQMGAQGRVDGNLLLVSEESITLDSSKITGEVVRKTPDFDININFDEAKVGQAIQKGIQGLWFGIRVSRIFTLLIVGLLLMYLVPGYFRNIEQSISKKPWMSLGVGFLVIILAPIVGFILLITLIGLPLSLILMAVYFILLHLAPLPISYWLGSSIMKNLFNKESMAWSLVIGIILYGLLSFIPLISMFLNFLVALFGVGAYSVALKERKK